MYFSTLAGRADNKIVERGGATIITVITDTDSRFSSNNIRTRRTFEANYLGNVTFTHGEISLHFRLTFPSPGTAASAMAAGSTRAGSFVSA